jgi:putative membrane protein
MADPRVFFAAERTLLAWVRSGLTVIALGFVVARFGLFLSLLSGSGNAAENSHSHGLSGALGTTLVVMGAFAVLAAMYNHRCYIRTLPVEDVPPISLPWLTTLFSLTIAVTGLLLAAYLVITG